MSVDLFKRPWVSFLVHYLAWELLYMLTGLPILLASQNKNWDYFIFTYGILGSVNFVLFYGCAFYLIPALFFRQRQVWALVITCVVLAILFTLLKYQLEVWNFGTRLAKAMKSVPTVPAQTVKAISSPGTTVQKVMAFPAIPLSPPSMGAYFRNYLWFSFLIIIIAFAYRLLLIWYAHEKVRKELENQKLRAELSFLKMQINPHFLFNALNNIYSMAIIEKASRTSNGVMKLSEMVRYMLYEKEDEKYRVTLDKEIAHINNYIDLQKLRYDGDMHLHFTIEGEVPGKKIPPLLLFPLIENACKHGILQDPAKPVTIQMKVSNNQLHFSIHNYKNHFLKDQTGGIGLVNVQKRLSLLYDNQYQLDIQNTLQEFHVQLELPL